MLIALETECTRYVSRHLAINQTEQSTWLHKLSRKMQLENDIKVVLLSIKVQFCGEGHSLHDFIVDFAV